MHICLQSAFSPTRLGAGFTPNYFLSAVISVKGGLPFSSFSPEVQIKTLRVHRHPRPIAQSGLDSRSPSCVQQGALPTHRQSGAAVSGVAAIDAPKLTCVSTCYSAMPVSPKRATNPAEDLWLLCYLCAKLHLVSFHILICPF